MKFIIIMIICIVCMTGCSPSPEKIFSEYKKGNKEFIYQYVENGGNVCIFDKDLNVTLLGAATDDNDLKLYNLIFKNKTYSLDYELKRGFTFIHAAAANDRVDVLEKTLSHVSNVNLTTITPLTPIMYAIIRKKLDAMKFLLKHESIDINFVHPEDTQKQTAAHIASARGYLDGVKLLLKNNADFSIKNSKGQTPLEFAKARLLRLIENDFTENELQEIKETIKFLENLK